MKPGASRNAPPTITIAPSSTSRVGALPAARASLKRAQAAAPCERASAAPTKPSTISSASVGRIPIASPTLTIT